MKKYITLILLLLMFIPFYVKAESCDIDKISISSITIEEKSDNVEELDEATTSGKNINLNLSMLEVGDNIEYKIVVKNDSNKDYELDKNSFNISSDYIKYSFESEDDTNIVKANSSKVVYLKVNYINEVPDDVFESGTYNDKKSMTLSLFNGNTINVPDTLKNPNTGVQSYILIPFIILLISITTYLLLKKKKYTLFMVLIIGALLIIPISIYALCTFDIKVESNIQINQEKTFYTSMMTGMCPSENYYVHKIGQKIEYYKYFIFENNSRVSLNSYDSLEDCENNISQVAATNNKDVSNLICKKDFFGNSYYDYWEDEMTEAYNGFSFIRHKVKNNVIINSDLGFAFNNKVYYLIGGDSTENVENNLRLVKSLFGEDSCVAVNKIYYRNEKGYRCRHNNIDIGISEKNDLEYSLYNYIESTFVYSSGESGIGLCT